MSPVIQKQSNLCELRTFSLVTVPRQRHLRGKLRQSSWLFAELQPAHIINDSEGVVSQVRMNATMIQNAVTYDTIIAFDNPDLKLWEEPRCTECGPLAVCVLPFGNSGH